MERQLPPTLRPSDADYGRERYDTAQAALYLNVPISAVYTAIAGKTIGHRRQGHGRGGRVRFSQADLDAWRLAQRVEPDGREETRPRLVRTSRANDVQALMPKHRAFA